MNFRYLLIFAFVSLFLIFFLFMYLWNDSIGTNFDQKQSIYQIDGNNSSKLPATESTVEKSEVSVSEPKEPVENNVENYKDIFIEPEDDPSIQNMLDEKRLHEIDKEAQAIIEEVEIRIKEKNMKLPEKKLSTEEKKQLDDKRKEIEELKLRLERMNNEAAG